MSDDTSVTISIDGTALPSSALANVQSIDVNESRNAQTQVSIVVTADTGNASNWTSPLDSLVNAFAEFEVAITRGNSSLVVPARATSAAWSLQAGGPSTMTIAGLDASAELDREDKVTPWAGRSDADIAKELLGHVCTAPPNVSETDPPDGTDKTTPYFRGTDWQFLRILAERNQYDVYITKENGQVIGVFGPTDPRATPSDTLDLGYGALGGRASADVQLVSSQSVKVTYSNEGQPQQQVAFNDGKGQAMGTQSLGGAVTVLRYEQDLEGRQKPDVAARVLAENSAFGASLSVTLVAPTMPLLRARRTVTVRGLGPLLSGLWLVTSVRHTITPGGHTQSVSFTRNALGDGAASGAGGLLGAAPAAVGR